MKNKLYCIKDIKVGFRGIIELANDEVAKRTLYLTLEQDKESELAKIPQDFELWRIGEFDHDKGEIVPAIEFICNLKEIAPKVGE